MVQYVLACHILHWVMIMVCYISMRDIGNGVQNMCLEGELDFSNNRIQKWATISSIHGWTCSLMNAATWICLKKYEGLAKEDHEIKKGIETTSFDNRSNILPIVLSNFLPNFLLKSQKRRRLLNRSAATCSSSIPKTEKFILPLGAVWVMTHSHVHLSTSVIDDQSLSRDKHIVWCGCYEILIQRSTDVLLLTRFCQLPCHSLSRSLFCNLKNSSTKWQYPRQNSRDKSFFLRKLTGFVPQFWIFDHTLCCVVCSSLHLCLSCSVAQFQSSIWFHFSLPRIVSFTLFTRSVQDTTPEGVLSLNAGALSLWHTHYLNGYMVWCGCHEILIPCSTTVLFSSNFALHPIQLCFWWLSYSDHSFQLISIQLNVHHSDPPRNHQSCYQEPFILTANWRQTHIQSYFSCYHSKKACEFIASTVYKIHSSAKSKALAIPERSQKYLPNHSKWRAHILDRIQYIILCLLSFRIRYAVVSNTPLSPIPCLNANVRRTYFDAS